MPASQNGSLTHAAGAVAPRLLTSKRCVDFLLRCRAERSPTHAAEAVGTPRPPSQTNAGGAFRLLLRGYQQVGARLFLCCAASRNGSLTHAAEAVGTPRTNQQKKQHRARVYAFSATTDKRDCVGCVASQNGSLTHSLTQPEPLGRRGHPATKKRGGMCCSSVTNRSGRVDFFAVPASQNGSLTHAAGAVGTPRPRRGAICCSAVADK